MSCIILTIPAVGHLVSFYFSFKSKSLTKVFNKPGPMTEPSGLTLEMPLGKDLGCKVYWSSTTGKVIQPALSPCYKKKKKNPFVVQVIILAGWVQRRLRNLDYLRNQNTFAGICCLVAKSCWTLLPHGLWPARLLCPWDFPGKNTGMGCHLYLQGIFPTQWSKLCLPHW